MRTVSSSAEDARRDVCDHIDLVGEPAEFERSRSALGELPENWRPSACVGLAPSRGRFWATSIAASVADKIKQCRDLDRPVTTTA
jgi:hypothetical protein